MSSTMRVARPETVLLAGGAISLLSVVGPLVSVYFDSDLGTPIGRFRAMSDVLGHFAPVLGASTLLLAGSWTSNRRGMRGLVAGCLLVLVLLSLVVIPTILPDARQLSSGVLPVELSRFRAQVVRVLLYLTTLVVLLSVAVWRYLRRTPLTVSE